MGKIAMADKKTANKGKPLPYAERRSLLIIAVVVIILAIVILDITRPGAGVPSTAPGPNGTTLQVGSQIGDLAPELIPGGQWFNTQPLTLASLRGKVVLIDFWTYTCINCIRTFPYISSWNQTYAKDGLVIIGVQTPEFSFERDASNVGMAIKNLNVTWYVMQDNDYATWNAYSNNYWPADYLIDTNGVIRYTSIGEGGYAQTESEIVSLLNENGANASIVPLPVVAQQNLQPTTYETYIGTQKGAYGNSIPSSGMYQFNDTGSYSPGLVYFVGKWDLEPEYAKLANNSQGGELILNYNAKYANIVLQPNVGNGILTVTQDGVPLNGSNAGADVELVNGSSIVRVAQPRLYNIINNTGYGQHVLRLITNSSDFGFYSFTFG